MTIECEKITTPYSATLNRPILNEISCKIHQGEFVALLGLNGAGKSSLLKAIVGLVPLAKGVIKVNNSVQNQQKKHHPDVAMLFQGGGLIRQLSAIENVLCGKLGSLSAWQSLWGFPKHDRRLALELLDRLGLKDQAYQKTAYLSGGQQQRVAIARALIQNPGILLADEPITGLDVLAAKQVMETLAKLHAEQGMTIVVVLHDLSLAAAYAQRAIVLEAGQIIYDGISQNLPEIMQAG
ncbi:phosphonate ABC transporter ATP-binding protein [Aerosakkonemataceae cyanobacterium BLCC-F154]|uniref:Phosphonate ABC transporter ATP-binding protein n=1 Tax=Floridaenema fluviatile BLCC-F154 TaxID=3153640 RepID=A0ABV4YKK0_9CYAN